MGAPGAEGGCQRHLGALLGAAAAPSGCRRWHVRFGHEDDEFLDEALDAPVHRRVSSWIAGPFALGCLQAAHPFLELPDIRHYPLTRSGKKRNPAVHAHVCGV